MFGSERPETNTVDPTYDVCQFKGQFSTQAKTNETQDYENTKLERLHSRVVSIITHQKPINKTL